MSCGVGRRHGSDPALLWLWCRLAVTALIRSLAWEPPYATGVALEKTKRPKKKKKGKKIYRFIIVINDVPLWLEMLIMLMYGNALYFPLNFTVKLKRLKNKAYFVIILFFRATPTTYGSSQARCQLGAVAASLHHSHSSARSKLHL